MAYPSGQSAICKFHEDEDEADKHFAFLREFIKPFLNNKLLKVMIKRDCYPYHPQGG